MDGGNHTKKQSPILEFMESRNFSLGMVFWPLFALLEILFYKVGQFFFVSFLNGAKKYGKIIVYFPDSNQPLVFGDKSASNEVTLTVKDKKKFLWRCLTQADIGFAEAYMRGEVDCTDLTMLFKIFIANRDSMNGLDSTTAWFGHLFDRFGHISRSNTTRGSRKNIEEHYDLSNDMFELFLDPSMTYSCAIFNSDEETLEQGQLNKIRAMITKAEITSTDHVLEIGSGWGALSIEAVRMTGCKVTTITLSSQQKLLVEQRVKAAGMQDKINVQLIDYREMKGQYDKIISVEMLEAVGHEFLPTYFECCWKLLKPGGKMAFQVITTPHKNYEVYRRGCDFIQKYIFPGSLCPSVNAVLDAIEKKTTLAVERMDNIGYSYARTLREWRINFLRNRPAVEKLGFDDRFVRKWEYYFCYCEAGFYTQYLGTYQIVLTHPKYLSPNEGKTLMRAAQ